MIKRIRPKPKIKKKKKTLSKHKEINIIHNEDCFKTMERLSKCVDVVLTSPPYNTSRCLTNERSLDKNEGRYDIHLDNMTDEEYLNWTVNLFKMYDKILKENGVILYNLSYSAENTHLLWLTIAEIIRKTDFMTVDTLIWKKKSAIPNNTSSNRLTRMTEYIFVFSRKSEFKTFHTNKKVTSTNARGQKYYENVINFIEAKNNDGSCKLNKATFSSDLCIQLLNIYAKPGSVVYDSFMGTGTTAVACKKLNLKYIGSEKSSNQCAYAEDRIKDV